MPLSISLVCRIENCYGTNKADLPKECLGNWIGLHLYFVMLDLPDQRYMYKIHILTLTVLVATIDALGHFETG